MSKDCKECGMPVERGDYHPYAACLMFKQCQDLKTVEDNLQAVVKYGFQIALEKL